MEHPQTTTAPGIHFVSVKLALSADARASLEAVRAAEESARLRARRQTLQARLWFAVLLGAGALVVGSWPRLTNALRGRSADAERIAARSAQPSLASSPAASPSPAADRPIADAPAKSTLLPAPTPGRELNLPGPNAALAGVSATKAGEGSDSDGACDRATVRSAPWKISAEACARAFQANPTDATLALAIAQAEHAHGSRAEAAQWAKRALALDPSAAEAYVIVARAEKDGNRPEEAREAYRRYLELAPRGWHHSEARAALRSERPRGD